MKRQKTLQDQWQKEEGALHVPETVVAEGCQDTNVKNATPHFAWSMPFWFASLTLKTNLPSKTSKAL